MMSTRSCAAGETTSVPATPPPSSVRSTATCRGGSNACRSRSAAVTSVLGRPVNGPRAGSPSWASTGSAGPFVTPRLRNHVKNTIGKPCAGKPHARIERGMGKRTGNGTAPLTTNERSTTSRERPADSGLRARQATRGAARADDVQAVVEREPLPAAARRTRGGDRGGGADEPLPRYGVYGAVRRPRRQARRAGLAPVRVDGVGRADLPAAPGVLRPGRRGRLRVAVVRGLPDRGGRGRRDVGAGAADGVGRARPGRDGRGDHRPHQGGPGL